jgi:TRAP-type transport system periplasmic protein
VVWLALTVAALAAAGCGGATKAGGHEQEHTLVLRIANHESADRDLAEYVAAVNRLSRGSIRLVVESGWRQNDVDYDSGTLADVRAGMIGLAKVSARAYDRLGVDDFQALVAPFLVDGLTIEERVLASGIPDEMLPAVRRLGVEGLALLPGPPRRPFSLERRLRGPGDYRDAVIGIGPGRVSALTFQALGAFPRGYTPDQLGPGFDGAELDLYTLEGNGYGVSGQSSVTANVVYWPWAFTVVANPRILERLTPAQREVLRKAGREALAPAIARVRDEDHHEATDLCRRYRLALVDATHSGLAALRAAVRPVYAKLDRNPKTRSLIREIEAMKRQSPREPPLRCSRSIPATKPTTLLDGTWTMTASRTRVRDATHDPLDAEIDSGRYRMTLRRGRITMSYVSPGSWTVRGTFTIPGGDKVLFHFPDEDSVYRWNLYRDALTLSQLPGSTAAPNPTFAPWRTT